MKRVLMHDASTQECMPVRGSLSPGLMPSPAAVVPSRWNTGPRKLARDSSQSTDSGSGQSSCLPDAPIVPPTVDGLLVCSSIHLLGCLAVCSPTHLLVCSFLGLLICQLDARPVLLLTHSSFCLSAHRMCTRSLLHLHTSVSPAILTTAMSFAFPAR